VFVQHARREIPAEGHLGETVVRLQAIYHEWSPSKKDRN
jgi:hypothetical protein